MMSAWISGIKSEDAYKIFSIKLTFKIFSPKFILLCVCEYFAYRNVCSLYLCQTGASEQSCGCWEQNLSSLGSPQVSYPLNHLSSTKADWLKSWIILISFMDHWHTKSWLNKGHILPTRWECSCELSLLLSWINEFINPHDVFPLSNPCFTSFPILYPYNFPSTHLSTCFARLLWVLQTFLIKQ